MRKILAVLAAGAMAGAAAAAYAKLPPPPAKSPAEMEKAAAAKAKTAAEVSAAQDRAVANYKRNQNGGSMSAMDMKKAKKRK
jgi:hypothetical protein